MVESSNHTRHIFKSHRLKVNNFLLIEMNSSTEDNRNISYPASTFTKEGVTK